MTLSNAARPLLLATLPACLGLASSVAADTIHLAGGDVLTGTVLERNSDHVVFDHASLGAIAVPLGEITLVQHGDIERVDTDRPAVEPSQVALNMMQDAPEDKEWESRLVLAGGYAAGNTDTQSLAVTFTTTREREDTILTALLGYYYGATDGDRSDNRFTAFARHEWLIPDTRWSYFVQGRYDFDEFQSWDYRIGGHGGVGYHLIDEEDFDLRLRAGAGATKEFNSNDDDIKPELLFGGDMEWQITEKQSIKAGSTIFPNLDDTGEFRTLSYADYAILVDEEANMSLTVGLLHEYESRTDPGIRHYDLRITAGLQFDF